MPKATFSDIAKQAGVGTATVERVLNGRGGVRPGTVEKVVAAALVLDYPRRLPDVHRGLLRIEVILVRPETAFFQRLSRAFERIGATLDPLVKVHRTFVEESDPRAIAARIASTQIRRAGLILAVPDHPEIRDTVATAAGSGLPIVHVVTRAAGSAGDLVSIDNYAAGRTAAHFLSRMQARQGHVMALCHPIYQVHRERMRGFSDYFLERRAMTSTSIGSALGGMMPAAAATCCSRRCRPTRILWDFTTQARPTRRCATFCAATRAASRSSLLVTN